MTFILTMLAIMMGLSTTVKAQQAWTFATVSASDQTNLNADTQNWTYESDNNRWLQQSKLADVALTANGVELEFSKGLKFTTTAADQVEQ